MTVSDLDLGCPVDGWNPPPFPEGHPWKVDIARLTPLDPKAHTEALFTAFAKDAQNVDWAYLPYGPFDSLSDSDDLAGRSRKPERSLFFTVMDRQAGPVRVA